jgi:hypothetical protein
MQAGIFPFLSCEKKPGFNGFNGFKDGRILS